MGFITDPPPLLSPVSDEHQLLLNAISVLVRLEHEDTRDAVNLARFQVTGALSEPLETVRSIVQTALSPLPGRLDDIEDALANLAGAGGGMSTFEFVRFWAGVRNPDVQATEFMFTQGQFLGRGWLRPIRDNVATILQRTAGLEGLDLSQGDGGILGTIRDRVGDVAGLLGKPIAVGADLFDTITDLPGQVAGQLTDVVLPLVQGAQEGVAGLLGEGLRGFFETSGELFGRALGGGLTGFLETLELDSGDTAVPLVDQLLSLGNVPDALTGPLGEARTGQRQIGGIVRPFLIMLSIVATALPALQILGQRYLQTAFEISPLVRPDPSTLALASFRGSLSPALVDAFFTDQGYGESARRAVIETSRPFLSPGEVRDALHRGVLSSEEADLQLRLLGYRDVDVARLRELFPSLPGIQDVIRFAVREAFDDQVSARFGTDQDQPELLVSEAARRGLSQADAIRFWRSHWELPSIGQGFDMFHRIVPQSADPDADTFRSPFGTEARQNVIGAATLQLLLRTQDVMPFWRDKVTEIAYSLPTRVDIRRFFEQGIVDENEVYFVYLGLGFSPTDAERNARFAIADAFTRAFAFRETEVRGQFRDGLLSEDRARSILSEAGPFGLRPIARDDVLDQTIRTMQIDREGERNAEVRSAWLRAYRTRLLAREELEERFEKLGLSKEEIGHLEALENLARRVERRQEIAAAVRRNARLQNNQIGSEQLRTQLGRIGVPEEEVSHLVREAQAWRNGDPDQPIPEPAPDRG